MTHYVTNLHLNSYEIKNKIEILRLLEYHN
jgi:hypothetical protein